jgi:oligoendopeptidase F
MKQWMTTLSRAMLCAATISLPALAADAPTASAANDAANPAYQWDLADLYASPAAWTEAHDKAKARIQSLDKLSGTLGKNADSMFKALDAISREQKDLARLATYASLKRDENVKIAVNAERFQQVQSLAVLLGSKTAWVGPEIIAIGPKRVHEFLAASKPLKARFDFFLDNTLRGRDHTLSAEGEQLMASAGEVLAQPDNIFSQLVNGELPFRTVTLSDGQTVKIDQAAYEKYRQVPNRDDRKKVFDAFFGTLTGLQGTLGATLNTQVLAEELDARVRHYPNALADATFADNMPETVYRTLVAEANAGLPTLHRYLKMRKTALGIDGPLGYQDMYPSIFPGAKAHYTVDQMKQISLAVANEAYGPEYADLLKRGFAQRWMDLFPREGKANGAYMNGSAYDVHPYLLFNNHDDYMSLSTFLHEWGHAVHTMLATKAQPFEKSSYSTFIAETASIGNEMVLSDYMVRHAATDAEKIQLLGEDLERIRQTFFRQTMFAEFQLAIHEEVEQGRALSGQRMSDLYCGIVKKYYGDAQGVTKIDPAYCVEWAYIPHFYYGFYVYQYATSMVGAAWMSDEIAHAGAPARARFLDLLKAGGSDYPYALYKKAGLDMATPAPYRALVARMGRDMDQIEALTKKAAH